MLGIPCKYGAYGQPFNLTLTKTGHVSGVEMEHVVAKQLTTVVTVQLADREDGGLRVSSVNLPGLLLSGRNKQEVCDCIAPAISELFARLGYKVSAVRESSPLSAVIKKPSPREVEMQVQHNEHESLFVVDFAEAEAA